MYARYCRSARWIGSKGLRLRRLISRFPLACELLRLGDLSWVSPSLDVSCQACIARFEAEEQT